MFPIRRAALRLLTSGSTSFAVPSSSLPSFASRTPKQILASNFLLQAQRRWATQASEASNGQVPVSQLQATPQEEVENAISEDNAAPMESYGISTASEDTSTAAGDSAAVGSAVGSAGADAGSFDRPSSNQKVSSNSAGRKQSWREPKPTVYVGNLFFDVTEDDLTKEVARFGQVQRVRLIRDPRGLSKGFGYVQFASTEEAVAAVENLNQQMFEGRRLTVQYADHDATPASSTREGHKSRPSNPPSKTLFIGNMSFEMTDRDLNDLFRGIRNVIDVRVAIDRRTGQPRGFAHADFIDVKSAQEALSVLADKETYGRKLRIDYSHGPSSAPKNTPSE